MARAATTSDVFNAVAEPRRREILSLLVVKELPVGDIVALIQLDQPSVSKHLRVLRDVGLCDATTLSPRLLAVCQVGLRFLELGFAGIGKGA